MSLLHTVWYQPYTPDGITNECVHTIWLGSFLSILILGNTSKEVLIVKKEIPSFRNFLGRITDNWNAISFGT